MRKHFFKIAILATLVAVYAVFIACKDDACPLSLSHSEAISLNGDWKLSFAPQPRNVARTPEAFKKLEGLKTVPAQVPGNAEIDLQRANILADIQKGDNIYELRKFEGFEWMYSRKFSVPELERGQRAVLNFEGIDTLADVFVNGRHVGSPENMFVSHEFDITEILKDGSNTLDVIIRSVPIESGKFAPIFGGGCDERSEFLRIRKAPSDFGWDIHPRVVTAGIWRGAGIEIRNPLRIEEVNVFTRSVSVSGKSASICVDFKIDAPFSKLGELKRVIKISKDGKVVKEGTGPVLAYVSKCNFDLGGVELWWPRGYGKQPIYDVKVEIVAGGKTLASRTVKTGFRTVRLDFKELELPAGENLKIFGNGNVSGTPPKGSVKGEFKFYVNNTPIFIKGTNWVPLDASHSRDKSHLKVSADMLADLNCNMVRCWGGNVYEDADFYEMCDNLGILVWQDFALGCNVYPQDCDFAKTIHDEVSAVVRKLRNHPSIALWAGNNENDQAYTWRLRGLHATPERDRIARDVIPAAVFEFDWTRPYLPSSPYLSGITFENPQKYAAPEVHLWGPRGYYKDSFYKDALAIFVSEIGYHGCPNRPSLEKMMNKKFVYPWDKDGKWNKEWQAKAVMPYRDGWMCSTRNDLMTKQAKILFGECPKDLDDFIFASQVVQAEAKKYFIELWRTQKFEPKTGILWWNLRDGWPILSDAVVDFYNSKKLAYYYIKRVQTDVCVMVGDGLYVVAANDTLAKVKGSVKIRDAATGREVFAKDFEVSENGKTDIGKIDNVSGQGMLVIEYSIDGGRPQLNHYLYGAPPFKLDDYKNWYKQLNVVRD